MRTAVLITGQLRGFHLAVQTWGWLLKDRPDVYYVCSDPADDECRIQDIIPWAEGFYVLDTPEQGRHVKVANQWGFSRTGPASPYTPGVVLGLHWYKVKLCGRMIQRDYDLVVQTRPDNYFQGTLDLAAHDPAALWLSDHFNWGGYCDRLAFGNPAQMRYYCDFYDHLNDWIGPPAEEAKKTIARIWLGNSETRLRHYLAGRDVRFFPLEFCCIQPDGRRRFNLPKDRGAFTVNDAPTEAELAEVRRKM